MPKGHKTSASPATQKKHARKAAASQGLPLPKPKNNNAKGKGKGKNKEPRKKGYIPPFKPAPIEPDPLDALGLAKLLPPELVVVLRKLAKKDTVTKRKALEELQADWISKVGKQVDEGGYDAIETHLLTALPVWVSLDVAFNVIALILGHSCMHSRSYSYIQIADFALFLPRSISLFYKSHPCWNK